jgi:hypothetical protein
MSDLIICPHCGITSRFNAFFWDGKDRTTLYCRRCGHQFKVNR